MPIPTASQKRVSLSLRTADRDMEIATLLVQQSPHLYEGVGFHCQQAVEKYLKAVLVTFSLPSPFIHDLTRLLDPLQRAALVQFSAQELASAGVLNDFAVDLRYEVEDAPSYTSADLLSMAQQFRDKLRPLALAFTLS